MFLPDESVIRVQTFNSADMEYIHSNLYSKYKNLLAKIIQLKI